MTRYTCDNCRGKPASWYVLAQPHKCPEVSVANSTKTPRERAEEIASAWIGLADRRRHVAYEIECAIVEHARVVVEHARAVTDNPNVERERDLKIKGLEIELSELKMAAQAPDDFVIMSRRRFKELCAAERDLAARDRRIVELETEVDTIEAFAEMVVSRLVTAGHDYARDSHLVGCEGCRDLAASVAALYAPVERKDDDNG